MYALTLLYAGLMGGNETIQESTSTMLSYRS